MSNDASSHLPAQETHASSNNPEINDHRAEVMPMASTAVQESDNASEMTRAGHSGLRGKLDNLRDRLIGTKEQRAERAAARRAEVETYQRPTDVDIGQGGVTTTKEQRRRGDGRPPEMRYAAGEGQIAGATVR